MNVLTSLIPFFQDNWMMALTALVGIWLIISYIKTIIKWVLLAAVVVVAVLYVQGYTPEETKEVGKAVASNSLKIAKEGAIKGLVASGADGMVYEEGQSRGDFTISGERYVFTGNTEKGKGTISTDKGSVNVKINDTLKLFIDTVKSKSGGK